MKIILFTFILFSNLAWSLEGRIRTINDERIKLSAGDVSDLVIEVWPKDKVDPEVLSSIENTTILGHFYISEIKSIQASENNSEVYEVIATATLLSPFSDMNLQTLELKHLSVPVSFRDIEVEMSKTSPVKDYHVVDQDLTIPKELNYPIIGTVILLGFILILIFRKIKNKLSIKKRNKVKNEEKRRFWDSTFKSARQRKDFESLYLNRNDWMKIIDKGNPGLKIFFKVLEEHQYKEHWSEDEFNDVASSFNNIRNILGK